MLPGQPPKPPKPLSPDINQKRQEFYQNKQNDVARQFRGAQQEQDDAIARRMTAIGQAGSGAAIGLQMKGRDQIMGQQQEAMNALTGQQSQEDLSLAMADQDRGFKRELFDVEQGNKLKELDLAERQFLMDKDTTEFNKRMAELSMNQKQPGLLDSLGLSGDLGALALGGLPGVAAKKIFKLKF